MTDQPRSDVDHRASGPRAFALCVVVGLLWLVALAGSQAIAWGQLPLGRDYANARSFIDLAFWSSTVALGVTTLGLGLNAWRASWGLLIAAAAFAVMASTPAEPIAVAMIALGAAATIQSGFYIGELGRLVRIPLGRAQAIVNASFTAGLPLAVWAFTHEAETSRTAAFGLLAVVFAVSCLIGLLVYRSVGRSPSRPLSPAGEAIKTGAWSPRTRWAFVLSALSSATTAANLATLPTVLEQHDKGGANWLAVVFAMHIPAALLVLFVWSPINTRWSDSGLRVAAALQAAGTLLLAMSVWLGWGFIVWQLVGFIVLNFARPAYHGSISAVVGDTGPKGAILLVAASLGASAAATLANRAVSDPGGISPQDFGLVFGVLSLVLTLVKVPTNDGGYEGIRRRRSAGPA